MMKDRKVYSMIGCAIEVHSETGCGFFESVCQEMLGMEFKTQGVLYKSPQEVI